MKLIVNQAFGKYAQGDNVTDPAEIKSILDSEQAAYVMKVATDAPEPAAEVAKPAAKEQPAK